MDYSLTSVLHSTKTVNANVVEYVTPPSNSPSLDTSSPIILLPKPPQHSRVELLRLAVKLVGEINHLARTGGAHCELFRESHQAYRTFRQLTQTTVPDFVPTGQEDENTLKQIQHIAATAQAQNPIPSLAPPLQPPPPPVPVAVEVVQPMGKGKKKSKGKGKQANSVSNPFAPVVIESPLSAPLPPPPPPPPPPQPLLPPVKLNQPVQGKCQSLLLDIVECQFYVYYTV